MQRLERADFDGDRTRTPASHWVIIVDDGLSVETTPIQSLRPLSGPPQPANCTRFSGRKNKQQARTLLVFEARHPSNP